MNLNERGVENSKQLIQNTQALFEARVREILLSEFQKFQSELKLTQENIVILNNSFSQTWI